MQYMLLLHVNQSGWTQLTKTEQEQGTAAYMACSEALTTASSKSGRCGPWPRNPHLNFERNDDHSSGRLGMKYLPMDSVGKQGWPRLTHAGQKHWRGA